MSEYLSNVYGFCMNKSAVEILGWKKQNYTKNKICNHINININNIEEIKKFAIKYFKKVF